MDLACAKIKGAKPAQYECVNIKGRWRMPRRYKNANSFLRKRLQTGFLMLNSIWLLRGKGVEKNLLSRQRIDTYLKSYKKMTNNEVLRNKKDFTALL